MVASEVWGNNAGVVDADSVRGVVDAETVPLTERTGLGSCALFLRDLAPDVDAAFIPADRRPGRIGDVSRDTIGEAVAEAVAEVVAEVVSLGVCTGCLAVGAVGAVVVRRDVADASRVSVGFELLADWLPFMAAPFAVSGDLSIVAEARGSP